MDFDEDDALVLKYKNNDKNAEHTLVNRYQVLITKWIYEFNNLRHMDLEQLWFKGLVAFYNVMNSYELSKGHFYFYCKTCCKRIMMSELKKQQNRLKHETPVPIEDLSNYMYLKEDDEEDVSLFNDLQHKGDINELEMNILELRSKGYSYKLISEKLNLSLKKIDNTIQALKRRFNKK